MSLGDTCGMGRMTLHQVFAALRDRLQHVEVTVDRRFDETQTAIARFQGRMERRIAKLDDRITTAFDTARGGNRDAHIAADDPTGSHR
jgi:hypothetical protein